YEGESRRIATYVDRRDADTVLGAGVGGEGIDHAGTEDPRQIKFGDGSVLPERCPWLFEELVEKFFDDQLFAIRSRTGRLRLFDPEACPLRADSPDLLLENQIVLGRFSKPYLVDGGMEDEVNRTRFRPPRVLLADATHSTNKSVCPFGRLRQKGLWA